MTISQLDKNNVIRTTVGNIIDKINAIILNITPVTLYNNANGSNASTITVSDDITKYHRLDIYFKDVDNVYGSTSIIPETNKYFSLASVDFFGTSSAGGAAIKASVYSFTSTTTLTKRTYWSGEWFHDSNNASGVSKSDKIYITKILGYLN